MIKLISIFFSFFIFSSCTNDDRIGKFSQNKDTLNAIVSKQIASGSQVDTAFKLDLFDAIPDTINECGEYFTHDTIAVTSERYIFLSNFTEFAIIKINGKNIYLKKDTIESKIINNKSYIAVYKSQDYKAVLKVNKTKSYDEG